jgi:hypothetical protein
MTENKITDDKALTWANRCDSSVAGTPERPELNCWAKAPKDLSTAWRSFRWMNACW